MIIITKLPNIGNKLKNGLLVFPYFKTTLTKSRKPKAGLTRFASQE